MNPNKQTTRNVQNIFDEDDIELYENMPTAKSEKKRVYVPWTICEENKIKDMAKTQMSNTRKLAALNKECGQNRSLGALTQKLHRTRHCRKRPGQPRR